MAASFALSWYRPMAWAVRLGKPTGRGVSQYRSRRYEEVEATAKYINSIDPDMDCRIEVFTS